MTFNFIILNSFWGVDSLEISVHKILSFAMTYSFASSCQSRDILFLFLAYLSWLDLLVQCWIEMAKWASLSCFWPWRGKAFDLSALSMMLTVVFHRCSSPSWGSFLLFVVCCVFLLWKNVTIFIKCISKSMEMIMWFLSFTLLILFIILIYFWILKQPHISEINPTCLCYAMFYNVAMFALLVLCWWEVFLFF